MTEWWLFFHLAVEGYKTVYLCHFDSYTVTVCTGNLVSSHVVTVQLPTRCLENRFLHRPHGSGYLKMCVSDVITVQQSLCRGLENSDYIITVVVTVPRVTDRIGVLLCMYPLQVCTTLLVSIEIPRLSPPPHLCKSLLMVPQFYHAPDVKKEVICQNLSRHREEHWAL